MNTVALLVGWIVILWIPFMLVLGSAYFLFDWLVGILTNRDGG